MKKQLLSITLLFLSYLTSTAQNVNIPDSIFKSALLSDTSINTNADLEIQISEAAVYNGTINVPSLSIANLTGIEAFTSLINLNCSNNQLSSLDVTASISLVYLDCSSNFLTNLNVSGITSLTQLYCTSNQLSTLDISSNTNLTIIDCQANSITSLSTLNNSNR